MSDDATTSLPSVILRVDEHDHLAEGQCDACPAGTPLPPYTPLPLGTYALPPTFTAERLDDHHWVAYAPAVSAGPAVLNDSALALLRSFERACLSDTAMAQSLVWGEPARDAVSKMRKARLLMPVPYPIPPFAESARTLVAWLHLTEDCNLRCSYCYLDATPAVMSPQVGDQAIDAIFRSAVRRRLSGVKLKYAGGEPTLVFPLIVRLHRRAARLAEEHAVKLDGVIISNGTLIGERMLEAMQALDLRLTISVDGLQTGHDCQRRFADGTGSFAAVSRTIERALSLGLAPDISITVTGRSLTGLPELVEWTLNRNLPFSINFYRESDLSESQADLRLDAQKVIETMRAVFKIIEANLPRRSLLASLVDRANLAWPHTCACGVGANYMVIDTGGRVAKCQMDIGCAATNVYACDPLEEIQASPTGIQNLPVDGKEGCCDCEWRYWCAGGCPLETYRATKRWDARSPKCTIYQALFPEVLRLEGLRLLKYEGDVPV